MLKVISVNRSVNNLLRVRQKVASLRRILETKLRSSPHAKAAKSAKGETKGNIRLSKPLYPLVSEGCVRFSFAVASFAPFACGELRLLS